MDDKSGLPSILVIDDNQADIDLLNEAILETGDRVMCDVVKSADAGVGRIDGLLVPGSRRPRVFIIDLRMPGHDGMYILQHIRGHPELNDIPVIILTSSTWQRDRLDCLRLGANHYRVKPQDWDGYRELVVFLRSFWSQN